MLRRQVINLFAGLLEATGLILNDDLPTLRIEMPGPITITEEGPQLR